jgi:hypothetical protein
MPGSQDGAGTSAGPDDSLSIFCNAGYPSTHFGKMLIGFGNLRVGHAVDFPLVGDREIFTKHTQRLGRQPVSPALKYCREFIDVHADYHIESDSRASGPLRPHRSEDIFVPSPNTPTHD